MDRHRFISVAVIAGFMAFASFVSGQSRSTVVIDPGHGGYDRGGVPGQRIAEKDKTLDVALRLRRVLQTGGYNVIMTRDQDFFVPLGTRVAIANSYPNATFVSIHFNCSTRIGANGIETYYYRSDSAGLAASIHRNVVASAPTENRGIRRRGFFVLRKTSIPSVLVECGFLTNPTEAGYAQNASYRQKLAEEIAAGVRSRGSVGSSFSTTRVATAETIPLQPYMDQTRVTQSKKSRSKRSARKTSRHKKKTSSKPAEIEARVASSDREG
jgi:N-acetylmuramoyl-L-alanine amidase